MLYDTTYYANVKPRRGVRRLPTAGRGGYHPQAASSDWRAILVDGHGRMVGETRPRGSFGSICPATKNAPPCGRAERLRKVIACRQNCPGQRIAYCAHFVARRSFLLKRRQAFQQAYYNGLPGPISPLTRNTLSQTPQPFGTRCQPCCCLRSSPVPSVVSATESNPTQSVSPSSFLPPRCHPMVSMRRFPI